MSGFGVCLARWSGASSAIEKPISTCKSTCLQAGRGSQRVNLEHIIQFGLVVPQLPLF